MYSFRISVSTGLEETITRVTEAHVDWEATRSKQRKGI